MIVCILRDESALDKARVKSVLFKMYLFVPQNCSVNASLLEIFTTILKFLWTVIKVSS